MNVWYCFHSEGVMMRLVVKTKWLFPIVLLALAVLTVEFPTSTSQTALADVAQPRSEALKPKPALQVRDAREQVASVAMVVRAKQNAGNTGDTPERAARLDDTQCGTY
jgi:hypothetical protein